MSTFPEPLPHGPIEELFPDVFVVQSTVRMNALVSFPRNMIIVREGKSLTLINAVRLSAEGEKALEALGKVEHLVKLGFFHTLDDPYTRHRFSPKFWAPAPGDASTEKLVEGGPSPLSKASVFCFARAKQGEAALLLEQPQGTLLITCDSVQNWASTAGCSLVGAITLRAMGFITPAKIGPIWLKSMTGGKIGEMKPDFDRLISHDFAHLIAGHGVLLRDGAKDALVRSMARTFRG